MSLNDIPLYISLIFGAGQFLFGVAMWGYGLRAGRWRRTGVFLLMLLGVWALCSGAAELVVSGMAVADRVYGTPSAAQVASVRGTADTALVAVSAALLVPLLLFAVWKRARSGDAPPRGSAERKD